MINDYRALAVFEAVAQAGSFSEAGRRLRLSTSVISHHVSKLEARLGVPLFFRSTRSISLTPEGRMILTSAQRMVHAGNAAIDALADQSDQPAGALRITVPAFGVQDAVQKAIWEFAAAHPMVTISVSSSDRMIDLVAEGFDLAIRVGRLSDSTLKSRRIGSFQRALVTAPQYLANRPPIATLDDLRACDFISLAMVPDEVTLSRKDEQVSFTPDLKRIEVDSIGAAKTAILSGLGVRHLPRSEVEPELSDGTLVEVLPEWRLPDLGVHAVWPDGGAQKKLTRRLIDFVVESGG